MPKITGDSGDNFLVGEQNKKNHIVGNDGEDTLWGKNLDDRLQGGKGDDFMNGGAGNDKLYGGQGDDIVKGGNGDDFIRGDLGTNTLTGGNGDDTFVINANRKNNSYDTIEDFDVDRQPTENLSYNDTIRITQSDGHEFCIVETEDGDVKLFVDDVEVATIKGSAEGDLSATDVLARMVFADGCPASVKLLDSEGNEICDTGGMDEPYDEFVFRTNDAVMEEYVEMDSGCLTQTNVQINTEDPCEMGEPEMPHTVTVDYGDVVML